MSTTTNYNFNKPVGTEFFNIVHQNDNWDLADTALKDLNDTQKSNMPNLTINHQTGKTFRYGYQVSAAGIPQVISEEVL